MKIAVPMVDGLFCSHFGGSSQFAFYGVDPDRRLILGREDLAAPGHEHGAFPLWLSEQAATVVLAGGIGARAEAVLARRGVQVVAGVTGEEPDALVRSYLDGTLDSVGNDCHGGEHDHPDGGASSGGCGRGSGGH